MRKFVIFVLVVIGIFYWASNFVKTGKLQNFIDNNSDKSWAPKIQFNLGSIYQMASKFEKAELCFNRILEKYPKSEYKAESLYQLGIIYTETKKRKLAREIYRKLLKEHPDYEKTRKVKKKLDMLMNY